MNDEIIKEEQIYMQDIICKAVQSNPKKSDFEIYNIVYSNLNISSIETISMILKLIKLNKQLLLE